MDEPRTDDQPDENKDESAVIEAADWALPEWVAFSRGVWSSLAQQPWAAEITLEPLPGVPEAALHGECEFEQQPYAIWIRFRHVLPVAPGQIQIRLFDELLAAPTIKALGELVQQRIQAFLNQTQAKARSTIIRAGATGNGRPLGPGMPKNMRRFK
jgi:hypothetical protein